jgi:hypothetical protein
MMDLVFELNEKQLDKKKSTLIFLNKGRYIVRKNKVHYIRCERG